ncbi:bactofilin family protein [Salipaludibacillus sp. HK11]|uniref:bactofilin family protein n=1 Tax=Salipaludibacillus sp. HK11 TaxID=3394320 RepID=UPI0039FC03DB
MFSKNNNEKKLNEMSTLIGEETIFKGVLDVNSSIRIDGQIIGEVNCQGDVTIGKTGQVENDLTARNLFIAGSIKGNVKVEGKIHIYDSGSLNGRAEMDTIIIEENGRFHGESIMNGEKLEKSDENVVPIDEESPSSNE